MDNEWKLRQQSEAAGRLMDELMGAGDDDPEFVVDAIEGETDLLETIAKAVDEIDGVEVLIEGLTKKISDFTERRSAMKNRVGRVRGLIEQAMVICDLQKLPLPTATLSLRKTKPGVVVLDEAAIPPEYFIEQPRPAPKLDKALLKEMIEAGTTVIGAELDNGSVSLTVRRK